MSVVKEQHITNETARKIFIGILNIKQQITIRKITFIVKVVRNSDDQLPTKLLTVWCNHKRRRGLILHTNKTFIVYNIHLVILWGERDHRSQHMGALFLWWKILASFNLRPRKILVVAARLRRGVIARGLCQTRVSSLPNRYLRLHFCLPTALI